MISYKRLQICLNVSLVYIYKLTGKSKLFLSRLNLVIQASWINSQDNIVKKIALLCHTRGWVSSTHHRKNDVCVCVCAANFSTPLTMFSAYCALFCRPDSFPLSGSLPSGVTYLLPEKYTEPNRDKNKPMHEAAQWKHGLQEDGTKSLTTSENAALLDFLL